MIECIHKEHADNGEGESKMTISREQNGNELRICLEGRLDTLSAPMLEAEFRKTLDGADKLTLDFSKVEYISSAGLRALLFAHRAMSAKGGMTIAHVNDIVREVFEVTGLIDVLTIE